MSSDPLALDPGHVHLWRAALDLPAERLEAFASALSRDEIERAERIRDEVVRRRFVAARGTLRDLICRYLGGDPLDHRIVYGPQGKPEVGAGAERPLHFNVSHSGPLALVAFSAAGRVGVDLERIRPVPHADRIAARIFPPDELKSWESLPEQDRVGGFFVRWSRLEAVAKLHGGGVWWLVGHGGDIPEAGQVQLRDLDAPPGYSAALAAEGAVREVLEMGRP